MVRMVGDDFQRCDNSVGSHLEHFNMYVEYIF